MRPLYLKFSFVFLYFLLSLSNSPIAMASSVNGDLTKKEKTKETTNPIKPRTEVGSKDERTKRDGTLPSPTKKKSKILPIIPTSLNEDVRIPTFTPLTLLSKSLQLIQTNFSKIVGPDPFRFTIASNKDSVAIGEEFELTVRVNWVDYGVNNGIKFLPEWYNYVLKVAMPKGFIQTGGDYIDYCTKPVDANNQEAIFTIKGKFEFKPEEAIFKVLRGFEGANVQSGFIWKGEKRIIILTNKKRSARLPICDEEGTNTNPTWEYSEGCFGNVNYKRTKKQDTNPCSDSYGSIFYEDFWGDTGVTECRNGDLYKKQYNRVPCVDVPSVSSQSSRVASPDTDYQWVLVESNSPSCACTSNWVFSTYVCISGVKKARWVDANECTLDNDDRVTVQDCFCADKTASWGFDSYVCVSGVKKERQKDNNSCSTTYNTTRDIDTAFDVCFCNSSPNWVFDSYVCEPNIRKDRQKDNNGCSATYNTYRDVNAVADFSNRNPTWSNTDEVQCSGTTRKRLQVNTNSNVCSFPKSQWVDDEYNSCTCGDTRSNTTATISQSGSLCVGGSSITLTASCPAGETVVWRNSASQNLGSSNPITISSSDTYYANCSLCGRESNSRGSITVNAVSPPSVQFYVGSGSNTGNSSCNNFIVYAGNNATSYKWYKDNGVVGSTDTQFTITTSNSGKYRLWGSKDGCEASTGFYDFTVIGTPAKPVVSIVSDICGQVKLTSSGEAAYTYTWKSGATNVQTGKNITLTQSGNYFVEVDNQGCKNTSDANNYTVNQAPVLPTLVTPVFACVSNQTLTAGTKSDGTSYAHYQWYKDNVILTGQTAKIYYASTVGTHSYKYRAWENDASCFAESNSGTITIPPFQPAPRIYGINQADGVRVPLAGSSSDQDIIDAEYGHQLILNIENYACTSEARWYEEGVFIRTGVNITVTPKKESIIYKATCMNGTCESGESNKIEVQITPSTVIVTQSKPAACAAAPMVTLTVRGCNATATWYEDVENDNNDNNDVLATGNVNSFTTIQVSPTDTKSYYVACMFNGNRIARSNTVKVIVPKLAIVAHKLNLDRSLITTACADEDFNLKVVSGCEDGIIRWFTASKFYLTGTGNEARFLKTDFSSDDTQPGAKIRRSEVPAKIVESPFFEDLTETFSPTNVNISGSTVRYRARCSVKDGTNLDYCTTASNDVVITRKGADIEFKVKTPLMTICEGSPIPLNSVEKSLFAETEVLDPNKYKYRWETSQNTNVYEAGFAADNTTIIPATVPFLGNRKYVVSSDPTKIVYTLKVYDNSDNPAGAGGCYPISSGKPYPSSQITDPATGAVVPLNTVTVTVNKVPTASATQTASLTNEKEITFKNTSKVGNNAIDENGTGFTATWDFGDGSAVSNEWSPTHIYPANSNYTAKLTVKNNTTLCQSIILEIPVSICNGTSKPNVPTLTSTATSICKDGSVTLTAAGCTGAGQTVQWSSKTGTVFDTGLSITKTLAATQDFTAICKLGACASDVSNKITVKVITVDVPVLEQKDTRLTNVKLYPTQGTYLIASGCDACTVEWWKKTGTGAYVLVAGQTAKTLLVQESALGTYTYKVLFKLGTCSNPNYSNEVTVTVAACPAIAIANVTPVIVCEGKTTVLQISTTQKGEGNTEWFTGNDPATAIATGKILDTYTASPGNYLVKTCGVEGKYYGVSAPVEVKAIEVQAAIAPAARPIIVETNAGLTLTGSDTRTVIAGQTLAYAWAKPDGSPATGASLSFASIKKADQGIYTLNLSKTVGTQTCVSTTTAEIKVNPINCNLDFNGNPVVACASNKGTITVNLTGVGAGKTVYYRKNGGDWQTTNTFTDLSDGKYTIEIMERTAPLDQYDETACDGKTGAKMVEVLCNPALTCQLRVKAVNAANVETTTLPRNTSSGSLIPLNLSVENLDGSDWNNITYAWTGPNGIAASTPTLTAPKVGTYTVRIQRSTFFCDASVTLGAEPCKSLTSTYVCGNNPAITGVADDATNRLESLAPGDKVQAGDFEITIVEITSGGSGGWFGKGYTIAPFLGSQIAIEIKNAVFNNCNQLTNGNATAVQPTVFTEYDPNWGSIVDLEGFELEYLRLLIQNAIDRINIYNGNQADADEFIKIYDAIANIKSKIQANTKMPTELKSKLIADIDNALGSLVCTKTTLSTLNIKSARVSGCNIEELKTTLTTISGSLEQYSSNAEYSSEYLANICFDKEPRKIDLWVDKKYTKQVYVQTAKGELVLIGKIAEEQAIKKIPLSKVIGKYILKTLGLPLAIAINVLDGEPAGLGSYRTGTVATQYAETVFIIPDFTEVIKPDIDIEVEPFKDPQPLFSDENDDCKDDGKKYCVYICKRNYKCGTTKIVTHPLKYVGISTFPPELVAAGGRYNKNDVQASDLNVILRDLTKCEARGVEQLIIELNNNDSAFPFLSTKIDNFINSTSPARITTYALRNQLGKAVLERSRYKNRWRTLFLGDRRFDIGGFLFRGNEYINETCNF